MVKIDASQTHKENGEILELAIRAAFKASDIESGTDGQEKELNTETLIDVHAQFSNEIGDFRGCEEQTGQETMARA